MRGLADSAYTATSSGWGVWFVAVVLILGGLAAIATFTVRAAGRWVRSKRRHPLAPPHPRHVRIRPGAWR